MTAFFQAVCVNTDFAVSGSVTRKPSGVNISITACVWKNIVVSYDMIGGACIVNCINPLNVGIEHYFMLICALRSGLC